MPFAFVIIGLLLIITSLQNTYNAMGSQLAKDFTGANSFSVWALGIVLVGAIGYSETARPFSRAFLVLIILAMLLSKKASIFTTLTNAIKQGGVAPAQTQNVTQSNGGISDAFGAAEKVITGLAGFQ